LNKEIRLRSKIFRLPVISLAALVIFATAAIACGSDDVANPAPAFPTPTIVVPTAVPTPSPWAIDAIVDPTNFGWPRVLQLGDDRITIESPPERLHTLSLGHDEIVVALVGAEGLVGIGSFTANETYSNVAAEVGALPRVKRDAEEVVSLNPDLVIASKFTKQDLVDTISGTGIQTVRTTLESSSEGHETNIRTLAYMLGAEDQAEKLIAQIQSRIDFVQSSVADAANTKKPGVLVVAKFSDSISAAGSGTTEGGIVGQAGGENVAATSGIEAHETVSIESIIAMNPDVIVITQPDPGATDFAELLKAEPALANVPAIANDQILLGDPRYFTTLSHWNVRGIEDLATVLYPEQFAGVTFGGFE
jgi:iron complex transport system substrate-binding protein